jgi:hypothetical protein
MKLFTSYAKSIGVGLLIAIGTASAIAWTGPTSPAPNGNTPAPINVGLNTQAKLGQLFINTDLSNPYSVGLAVFGTSTFNGAVQIKDGTAKAGKVLTAVDDNGTATWASSTGGAGVVSFSCPSGKFITGFDSTGTPVCKGASQTVRFDKPGTYSWKVPAGVTSVAVEAWAGGGGGGGNDHGLGGNNGGGGGGSGSYSSSQVSVTSGTTYTVIVGAGGFQVNDPGGRDCGPYAGTGGSSSLALSTSPTTFILKTNGGTGGRLCYSTPAGSAGIAGVGDITFAGKNGGIGATGPTMGDGGAAYDGTAYSTFIKNTTNVCPVDDNGTHSYYSQTPGTGGSGGGVYVSGGVNTGGRKYACPGTDGLVVVSY